MTRVKTAIAVLLLFFAVTARINAQSQNRNNDFPGFVLELQLANANVLRVNVEAKTEDDKALVRWLVSSVYPNLEDSQKALINQGLFFVMNYDEKIAEFAQAFGPEDDTFPPSPYVYPDTTLYPQGTIKINFTLATLDFARLVNSPNIDPKVSATLKKLLTDTVSHEIKHVEQYINHPVLALFSPADCPEGICDEKKLADTKIKMGYEFEATVYGWEFGPKNITAEEWAYAANWLKDHKELMGKYVSGIEQMPFENLAKPIRPSTEFFYGSMYFPAVWAKSCAEGTLADGDADRIKDFFEFNEKTSHFVETAYPYLPPVVKRLKTCVQQ